MATHSTRRTQAEPAVRHERWLGDEPGVSRSGYRLGIDEGEPGDAWFDIGWDVELGSFNATEWQRDPNADLTEPVQQLGRWPGELPDVDALQSALGFTLPSALIAELEADRHALDLDDQPPEFDEFALAEALHHDGLFPRYQTRVEGSLTVLERVDWDGADPFLIAAGEWSPITTLVWIDLDRETPAQPEPGPSPQWLRLNHDNGPGGNASWRIAFDPQRNGFVAAHVETQPDGRDLTTRTVGHDPVLLTVERLGAAIGREVPAPLAARLEVEQMAFDRSPYLVVDPASPAPAPELGL